MRQRAWHGRPLWRPGVLSPPARAQGRLVRAMFGHPHPFGDKDLPVAVTPRGDVMVADSDEDCVKTLRMRDGAFVRRWSGRDAGAFHHPCGICLSGERDGVVVSDSGKHRVHVFSGTTGTLERTFGSEGRADGQLLFPVGVAATGGEVFVADHNNHRISVFRLRDGAFARSFGAGQLSFPHGIAVSAAAGEVYVADYGKNRICVFRASDGVFLRSLGERVAHVQCAVGVALTAAGALLVTSRRRRGCAVLSAADGRVLHVFAAADYSGCDEGAWVAAARSGEVVLGDGRNRRVQVYV